MDRAFSIFIIGHIVFGMTGLIAFWVPVFAKKGGATHLRFGKIFVWCAYGIVATALAAISLRLGSNLLREVTPAENPARFGAMVLLCYLSITTLAGVRHATAVVQTRRNPAALRNFTQKSLAITSMILSGVVIAYAFYFPSPLSGLLFGMSPIGILIGRSIWQFIHQEDHHKRAWFYQHMAQILGAGIAFHTAFAVFGFSRLTGVSFQGWVAFLPWLAPSVIGIPAATIWEHVYRRKFGDHTATTLKLEKLLALLASKSPRVAKA